MGESITPWALDPWLPRGPARAHLPVLRAAIEAAAQGRYRIALVELEPLDQSGDSGAISAACALRASILRQLHQHDRAGEADQRALVHAVGPASSDTRVDALVGLAADVIGEPDRALERWAGLVPLLGAASDRVRVRAGWVGAEVHLAARMPEAALELALGAAELAPSVSSRHVAKSSLVLGVCWHSSGEEGRGIALVRQATLAAADRRLLPLLWPGAYVLAGWLPAPEGRRWWGWAREVVTSIARGLPDDLLAGWRTDQAVRSLMEDDPQFEASDDLLAAGSLCSHER